ncbi:MAG TPA: hypothetical protein VD815_05350 [Candidatus Saccharimonadales bacterium]|nr:hypothetical protein [Candidatus Saccharimonadales bacterium]
MIYYYFNAHKAKYDQVIEFVNSLLDGSIYINIAGNPIEGTQSRPDYKTDKIVRFFELTNQKEQNDQEKEDLENLARDLFDSLVFWRLKGLIVKTN